MIDSKSHKLVEAVKKQLQYVMDPELPFLSISEMGMLRDVYFHEGHTVIVLTPTYSGCPATDVISEDSLKSEELITVKYGKLFEEYDKWQDAKNAEFQAIGRIKDSGDRYIYLDKNEVDNQRETKQYFPGEC